MTITAKNYAAQAERGLVWHYNTLIYGGYNDDAQMVRNIAALIKDAVKFVLPDDGRIFDDELKGLVGNEMNLPYPIITIEYYQPNMSNKEETHSYFKGFFELIEALSCTNVEATTHQEPCLRNEKRIKDGKLPQGLNHQSQ